MSDFNAQVISEFRAKGGAVGGPFEGIPLVLLTHRGARSGVRRTTPLRYYRHRDRLIVFASNLGSEVHPAWFHNLVANPQVTVEVGNTHYEGIAEVIRDETRDRLWSLLVQELPFLLEHQHRAGRRTIPLVAIRRATQ